jgi:hypothetical protein
MASDETYAKMVEAYGRASAELKKESDRGCVVLAFAWMDELLTKNLQAFLLPSSKPDSAKADELLGPGRPVGDASTKIDLSLRLGLLRANTHRSLHLVRRLRNDFAHLSSPLTFENPSVRDRIGAVLDNEVVLLNALWEAVEEDRGKPGPRILRDVLGTRRMFEMCASGLIAALVLIGDTLVPIQPSPERGE